MAICISEPICIWVGVACAADGVRASQLNVRAGRNAVGVRKLKKGRAMMLSDFPGSPKTGCRVKALV